LSSAKKTEPPQRTALLLDCKEPQLPTHYVMGERLPLQIWLLALMQYNPDVPNLVYLWGREDQLSDYGIFPLAF